ncbi:cytochrome P450 [Linderina pennispora]|uniref:Cytochrome P450 n=1 Tax=Linderina pennispora TaxID=61395 RepID=A0A1Y1WHR8_9FUNG|nr:cytochrome P450 [Linderina pennispora]ORX73063.1 cytochrome P450 [Linderina pennispora]
MPSLLASVPTSSLFWWATPKNLTAGLVAYLSYEIIYALYFSPLRNVPGSFWARISKIRTLISDIKGDEPEYIIANQEKYGSVFMLEPYKVAICDPSDCRLVLSTHAFRKDRQYGNIEFLEPNMFLTVDPELNKQRRRQIGPALGMASLRRMEPKILAAGVVTLVDKWGALADAAENGEAKGQLLLRLLDDDMHRPVLTSDDRRIVRWVNRAFTLMFMEAILPFLKHSPFNRILRPLYQDASDFITFGNAAIKQRKQELEQIDEAHSDEKPADILQSLIDAEDPESKVRMTSGQVTSENIITLMAGTDTTSNTLSWGIHLLLLHPKYHRRAVEEVRSQFTPDHVITFDEAKARLPYLEACVYETLRLRPVSGNLPRIIPRGGVVIQGYFIPEGYSCSVCLAGANMNPDTWKRPHVFYPGRFVDCDYNKHQVLTFSAGVRVCPGRNLAMVEIMTTLANVLNRFDLRLPEDSLFKPDIRDQHGLPIIMPRNNAVTSAPMFPDRDCNVVISRRK